MQSPTRASAILTVASLLCVVGLGAAAQPDACAVHVLFVALVVIFVGLPASVAWSTIAPHVPASARRHLVGVVFLALVAWGAVDGGAWGLGFAIFVALGYLEATRTGLAKLETAAKG